MKNSIHLLITGKPGVGKTTLLKEIIRVLLKKKLRLDGFYTEEIRKNQKRVGFRIMNIQGQEEGILSHSGLTSRYRIGKYRVDVDKMDEIVEKIRRSIKSEKIDVVIIDEIGPMELYSENFKGFIINMLKRNAPVVIGTIKEKCLHLLEEWGVSDMVEIKKITERERKAFDKLASEIITGLRKKVLFLLTKGC